MATDGGLAKWFPALHIENRGEGKLLVFEMDDFREEMQILCYEAPRKISYTWDSAKVEFELQVENLGTHIFFKEEIPCDFGNEFADSAKDMAGWLVQNECIALLLEGKTLPNVEDLQEKWKDFVCGKII